MFESIPSCSDWQCINSFAPWISAIGTFAVSGIALWLSLRDRYIRLKADFSIGLVGGDDPLLIDRKVYILSFANIGSRNVTVTNYEWRVPFQRERVITFPFMDLKVAHLCSKFPIELTDGQSGNIFHADYFFRNMNDPERFVYPRNPILAYMRIHFFKMYINTSVGKKVKVNIYKAVRKSLWKEYRSIYT